MLSNLSLTFYSEFLSESLHKINSADLIVIKTILDVPEMNIMCGLFFFPFILWIKFNGNFKAKKSVTYSSIFLTK